MADKTYHDKMVGAFSSLLEELPETWPKEDKEFVFEEVGHGEYGDALENLIALGLQDDREGFSLENSKKIGDSRRPWV